MGRIQNLILTSMIVGSTYASSTEGGLLDTPAVYAQGPDETMPDCPAGYQTGERAHNSNESGASFTVHNFLDSIPGLVKFRSNFEANQYNEDAPVTLGNVLYYSLEQAGIDIARADGLMASVHFAHPFLIEKYWEIQSDGTINDQQFFGSLFQINIGRDGLSEYEFAIEPKQADFDALVNSTMNNDTLKSSGLTMQAAIAESIWFANQKGLAFVNTLGLTNLNDVEAIEEEFPWADAAKVSNVLTELINTNNYTVVIYNPQVTVGSANIQVDKAYFDSMVLPMWNAQRIEWCTPTIES